MLILLPIVNRLTALISLTTSDASKASSTEKEPTVYTPARVLQQAPRNDIILAPPQSTFNFCCSRPAFTTSNVPAYAGSKKQTPIRVSSAGSPLPRVLTSTSKLLGNGEFQDEGPSVNSKVHVQRTSPNSKTIKYIVEPSTQGGVPYIQAPPITDTVARDLSLAHTSTTREFQTGWPEVEPLIIVPATKDRKSRFLPTLSKLISCRSTSSTTGNKAAIQESATEIVTSPTRYSDALEHQIHAPIALRKTKVQAHNMHSRGSDDSGYGTKSGSSSVEASPSRSLGPSSSHEWEGRDVGFG